MQTFEDICQAIKDGKFKVSKVGFIAKVFGFGNAGYSYEQVDYIFDFRTRLIIKGVEYPLSDSEIDELIKAHYYQREQTEIKIKEQILKTLSEEK